MDFLANIAFFFSILAEIYEFYSFNFIFYLKSPSIYLTARYTLDN